MTISEENFIKWNAITRRHWKTIERATIIHSGIRLKEATFEQDTEQATDGNFSGNGKSLSIRFRTASGTNDDTPGARNMTIRAAVKSGGETERDKLRKGWGGIYYYCFINRKTDTIVSWIVVDVKKMVALKLMDGKKVKMNFDHKTGLPDGSGLIRIPYRDLKLTGCILEEWALIEKKTGELF